VAPGSLAPGTWTRRCVADRVVTEQKHTGNLANPQVESEPGIGSPVTPSQRTHSLVEGSTQRTRHDGFQKFGFIP
jgi:hypothetical protein